MPNFASIPMFHDPRIFLPKLNALKLTTIKERVQHEKLACKYLRQNFFRRRRNVCSRREQDETNHRERRSLRRVFRV